MTPFALTEIRVQTDCAQPPLCIHFVGYKMKNAKLIIWECEAVIFNYTPYLSKYTALWSRHLWHVGLQNCIFNISNAISLLRILIAQYRDINFVWFLKTQIFCKLNPRQSSAKFYQDKFYQVLE